MALSTGQRTARVTVSYAEPITVTLTLTTSLNGQPGPGLTRTVDVPAGGQTYELPLHFTQPGTYHWVLTARDSNGLQLASAEDDLTLTRAQLQAAAPSALPWLLAAAVAALALSRRK